MRVGDSSSQLGIGPKLEIRLPRLRFFPLSRRLSAKNKKNTLYERRKKTAAATAAVIILLLRIAAYAYSGLPPGHNRPPVPSTTRFSTYCV